MNCSASLAISLRPMSPMHLRSLSRSLEAVYNRSDTVSFDFNGKGVMLWRSGLPTVLSLYRVKASAQSPPVQSSSKTSQMKKL